MSNNCTRLHVLAFGLALGILWAITMLLLGLAAFFFTWGTQAVGLVGSLYIGFEPTVIGSLIGMLWAFADGFIGGVIFAWLYNVIANKCCNRCKTKEKAAE